MRGETASTHRPVLERSSLARVGHVNRDTSLKMPHRPLHGPVDKIRVAIADDQRLVRRGLATILQAESDLVIVGETAHGPDAISTAKRTRPEVILLIAHMSRLPYLATCRRITELVPGTSVLILADGDNDFLCSALRAGAFGCIRMDVEIKNLLIAVRAQRALTGFDRGAARSTNSGPNRQMAVGSDADRRLSPREREILPLIAGGQTNHDVACMLDVSPYTVQSHR